MRIRSLAVLAAAVAVCAAPSARAAVLITEWMYSGTSPEFVEITNTGAAAVDMTGWSYDDNSRTAGSTSISSLGILAPGESAIIAEALTAAEFHAEWGTPSTLKVAVGNTNNLGRNDEINIYDAASVLADRLTYNDQGTGNVAGPRAQFQSGNPSPAALGGNNASLWTLSTVGDAFGSFASAQFDVGNPGLFRAVPEPTGAVLALAGLACLRRRRRLYTLFIATNILIDSAFDWQLCVRLVAARLRHPQSRGSSFLGGECGPREAISRRTRRTSPRPPA